MTVYRSITFAPTVAKQQRQHLGRFIDTELREMVKGRFVGQGVTFSVAAYPGGMNINNVHYPSGSVVKIVVCGLDGKSQATYVAGFDGKEWSTMSIDLVPSKPARKKR
jgi:hypothetical protein